jgi:asparagine synthetase B (glutamine-hydrolysing)
MVEEDPMTQSREASDRLSMFGQPLVEKAELLPVFRRARAVDDLASLLRLEDNYTAVYESGADVWIVNSLYSLSSYFYAYAPASGRFLHGDTLQAVASQGEVDLSWNHEAIANLLALEHLLGDETLARGVSHVPQGTILHWNGKRLTRKQYRFEDFAAPAGGEVHDRLVDLFLQGLEAGVGKRPIVTGSSGLDSRVNLAGMLHLGMRPEICVMGDPASKDVQVVQAMARAFDLRVNHVRLEPRDYLECALDVCRATNGIKPLAHWHSYILGK